MHRGSQFVMDEKTVDARIQEILWCGAAEPVLSELGSDPRLIAIAAQVLGSDTVEQLINQAHFKFPGDGVRFAWHQDSVHRRYGTPFWRDVNGRGSFVEIATAVDRMTEENGPLGFIEGTGSAGHIHGSEPNRGVHPRRLFLNGFAYPGANKRVYPGDGAGQRLSIPR